MPNAFLSTNQKSNLYKSIQIPVRDELVEKTGAYDTAVLLNQIVFSNKKELTLRDIRNLSLYDRTDQTLRKKLNYLERKGYISKRKSGMYGRYKYKANIDVNSEDSSILALIEGPDLADHPCYLTAAILNKFRQFALSNQEKVRISANSLKELLGTEKSVSLVRLILKRLAAERYLAEKLVDGIYEYHINTQKLVNIFNPEEFDREVDELLLIFSEHVKSLGHEPAAKQKYGWKSTFGRMLNEGYNYISIKYIIAYLGLTRNYDITTPIGIKRKYNELLQASEQFSKRKSLRYIYKLLHGMIPAKKQIAENSEEDDSWIKAQKFAEANKNNFRKWFYTHSAGVTDVDIEDYINQALIYAHDRFTKGKDDCYNVRAIKYRLQDYMYNKRCNDKDKRIKDNPAENTIYSFVSCDISEVTDRLYINEEEKAETTTLSIKIEQLLKLADERTAGIISDYHGLNGRQYNFTELAEKYNLSSAGYASRLYHKGISMIRQPAPPD